MDLKINGKIERVDNISSIIDLVLMKGLFPDKIVVEHNYCIVSREQWQDIRLQEQDNIEIVSFVAGG